MHLFAQAVRSMSRNATFDEARRRIDAKYSEIEQHLLEEFVKSERSNDCQRMKDLALILSQFKVPFVIYLYTSSLTIYRLRQFMDITGIRLIL